jgi:probable HAF family extracellular repeat protein
MEREMGSGFKGLVAGALWAASIAAHAVAAEWTIVDLTPEGMGFAAAVSQNGVVVGCRNTNVNVTRAFAYSNGQRRDLAAPEGSTSCALVVNDAGVIAGRIDGEITVWGQDGTPRRLGVQGFVTGIDDAGTIVGAITEGPYNGGGPTRAFMWSNGIFTDLGLQGSAVGINKRRQVAVISSSKDLYLYESGVLRSLGANVTTASGFNDRGEICGMTSFGHGPEPYLYDNTVHQIPGSYTYASAVALNNVGQALGSGEGVYGFLIEGGQSYRLDQLSGVATSGGFWNHLEGQAINDRGWIVGRSGGDAHAFLLMPKEAAPTPVAAGNPAARVANRISSLIRSRNRQ